MELRINSIDYNAKPFPIVKGEWVFDEGESELTITFDDLKTQCIDSVDHDSTWVASGFDDDGNKYSALATFSCGELINIDEIEQTENAFEKECRREYEQKKRNGDFDPEIMGLTSEERYLKARGEKYGWRHGL